MTFGQLLNLVCSAGSKVTIRSDSRKVEKGDVFVAIRGTAFDGHDFIDHALARGAKYVVCQRPHTLPLEHEACSFPGTSFGLGLQTGNRCAIPNAEHEIIVVEDSAEAAALLAQAHRGNPALQLTNLAVTGTNGKTTVAFLVRSVIQTAGERCGLIGTIFYDTGLATSEAPLTTPDCLAIAEKQAQMLKAGARYIGEVIIQI